MPSWTALKYLKSLDLYLGTIALLNLFSTNILEINNHKTMSGDLGMSRRILPFPFSYQGHINPMLELSSLLHHLCSLFFDKHIQSS